MMSFYKLVDRILVATPCASLVKPIDEKSFVDKPGRRRQEERPRGDIVTVLGSCGGLFE